MNHFINFNDEPYHNVYYLTSNFGEYDEFLFQELCYRTHVYWPTHYGPYSIFKLSPEDEVLEKARALDKATALFVPAWLPLNKFVKEEIRIARKLGIPVRFLSHWNLDDGFKIRLFSKLGLYSLFPWDELMFYF